MPEMPLGGVGLHLAAALLRMQDATRAQLDQVGVPRYEAQEAVEYAMSRAQAAAARSGETLEAAAARELGDAVLVQQVRRGFAACPHDTNGDGDCGRYGCRYCGGGR